MKNLKDLKKMSRKEFENYMEMYKIRRICFLEKLIKIERKHYIRKYGVCKACKGTCFPVRKTGFMKGARVECKSCCGLGFTLQSRPKDVKLYVFCGSIKKKKVK